MGLPRGKIYDLRCKVKICCLRSGGVRFRAQTNCKLDDCSTVRARYGSLLHFIALLSPEPYRRVDPGASTLNPKPLNLKPQNPEPLNPNPLTLNLKPKNPKPLNPNPLTLNPPNRPQTPKPKPLHPKPKPLSPLTLNPKP